MAKATHIQQYGDLLALMFDNDTKSFAYPMGGSLWITWDNFKIHQIGDSLALIGTSGERYEALPTVVGGFYKFRIPIDFGGGITPPGSGFLIDYYTPIRGWISGDWEDHSHYSRGGTDWPLGMRTPLPAPASGTLVNHPNSDAAGLKSMLIFDQPFPRKLPASNTLMNGVYRENKTAPAVAFMIQHLDQQVPEGHYEQGQTIGLSGRTAGPGSNGDVHLHAHLLAGTSIGSDRLDFMKFI